MTETIDPASETIDYDEMVDMFNKALIHTLRKHSIAGSFLDLWVPDADPVLGIASMIDSARLVGLRDIAIRVSQKTIPALRVAELERALASIGQVSIETEIETIMLRASAMKQSTTPAVPRSRAGMAGVYWQADRARATECVSAEPTNRWDATELPQFADVHPHFRRPLLAALGKLCREGSAEEPDPKWIVVTGQEDTVMLALTIDPSSHTVLSARHCGAGKSSERAILDLFCQAAENLPIQEVADHVGLKILEGLVDEDKPPPVDGVLLPVNAGAPFMLPPRLARKAYDAYRVIAGIEGETNFYYAPPAVEWEALSAEERFAKVDYMLRAFLQSAELYPDDMNVLRIDKNKYGYPVRVMVGFSDRVPVADKPNLMRRLEQRLRRDLEPEIDLVADRAKDKSPLRRLS